MKRFLRSHLLVLLFTTVSVHAGGLPDTGQETCFNDSGADVVVASNAASIARDAGTHPRQDCRHGRDAAAAAGALIKTGAGAKGFDYSKIANNGATLATAATLGTAATDWACTKDNITGLTWEVKTASAADLRYSGHTYTWYNSVVGTNGGIAGSTGTNTCNASLPDSQCHTEAFVAAVNSAALCAYSDWRMPTQRELLTLVNADGSIPGIDIAYFPNTIASNFWTGSSYVADPASAWLIGFDDGNSNSDLKAADNVIRLVRGASF